MVNYKKNSGECSVFSFVILSRSSFQQSFNIAYLLLINSLSLQDIL